MSDHEFQDTKVSAMGQLRAVPTPVSNVSRLALQAQDVGQVACRLGDASCARAHASALNRSATASPTSMARSLLTLQHQYGNQYVGQVLSRMEAELDGGDSDLNAIGRSIETARGGGNGLDHAVRDQMQSSFGADFSGVRVHTDTRADSLSRALDARAFATGKDIFFQHGEYDPGSSVGRTLLAHELTHVVQQNGNIVARQMSVSQPGDPEEVEADRMARAVMQHEQQGPLRAANASLSRQEDEMKPDPGAAQSPLQRQPEALKGDDEKEKHKL